MVCHELAVNVPLSLSLALSLAVSLALLFSLSLSHTRTCSNYGLACGPLGKTQEAEEAFTKALRIHEDQMGPESLQVGQTCHNLALLFRNTNQMEKAEAQYERSRKVWVKEEQWPLLAVSFKDSAIMYRNAGLFDQAFQMLDEAQAATKKVVNVKPEQVEAQLQLKEFRQDLEERRKGAATSSVSNVGKKD